MAAPYRHKNLELVPDIALALKRRLPSIHFVFEITIPAQHKLYTRIKRRAMQIGVAESLVSLGVLGPRECVDAYRACNVVLHPSLLEVFSVTYLEAMKMQRPLVVSDLPFAREICGEAALYFDPLSADSAAAQIAMLLESPDRVGSLTAAGERRQSEFPTGESKWRMVLSTLDSINAEAQSRR
jgi:glycosyltransferase involved in cell wall biosynthesis